MTFEADAKQAMSAMGSRNVRYLSENQIQLWVRDLLASSSAAAARQVATDGPSAKIHAASNTSQLNLSFP